MTSILKADTIQDADGNNIINESGNTITIGASGDNITIPSGASFTSTSAEKIGIGTTDPKEKLDTRGAAVFSGDHATSANAMGTAHGVMLTSSSGVAKITSISNGANDVDLELRALNGGAAIANQLFLDDDGNVLFSKNSTSDTTTGLQTTPNGALINVYNASGYSVQNRQADDGVFIYFKQANSTEGNISVSGTTVSYNGFTGTHWTRLSDNSKPTILKGTVLETLDEMVDWYNLEFDVITQDDEGNNIIDPQKIPHLLTDSQSAGDVITYNHNGTDYQATIVKEADIKHMKSKVSDTIDAKNVYGVFSHWDFGDDDGINDIIVASVGSFVVRIKSGETVAKGDLLQSNGDGTAKVQTDDNIKSSSFAKVLSTTKIETYDDGSFIVPCSLMC